MAPEVNQEWPKPTNANGTNAYTYDAWGNIISKTDSTGAMDLSEINPFVYKGYWYGWSTGLYYLNARYYNPAIGRFLSEDPIGPTPGNVLSYNEYAYAENNPVLLSDPSGMIPMEDEGDELGGDGAVTAGEQDAIALEVAGQGGTDAQSTGSIGEGTGEASAGLRGQVKARGLPTDGRFHFVPDGNKIEFNRSKGGYVDRYGSVWVKGPYHGNPKLGFTYEWDVQLSPSGKNAWGKFANGKGYINVRPDGGLSH